MAKLSYSVDVAEQEPAGGNGHTSLRRNNSADDVKRCYHWRSILRYAIQNDSTRQPCGLKDADDAVTNNLIGKGEDEEVRCCDAGMTNTLRPQG